MPKVVSALGITSPNQGLVQGLENLEIRGQVETHPENCMIKIGRNSEKSPRDLR